MVGIVLLVLAVSASGCAGSSPSAEDGDGDGASREVDSPTTDPTDDEPVVLRLGVGVEWSGDPADAGPASVVTRVLADLLHEGLTRLDATGDPVPALADGWSVSDDRLTWTFLLPDGLTDGDGAPLTARDVMLSLDHVAARGATDHAAVALIPITGWADRMAGESGGVAGLAAPDSRTLIIRLDRPFELVAHVLAAPAFGVVGSTDDGAIRTTGTYRYDDTADVLLAVEPGASVDRIELVDATGDVGAELLAAGDVDWAVLSPGRGADDIPGDILRQPLDLRVGVAVRLPDAAERHGVLAAIDPLALTTGIVAFAPLPSPVVEADRANPTGVPVEIPAGRLQPVAEALAGQLEAAGIAVDRVESDPAEFARRIAAGDAVVFPIVLAGGTDAEVGSLLAFTPGGVDDVWGVESEARTSLAAGIEAEADATQRALLVAALEQAVFDAGLLRIVGRLEVRLGVGSALRGLTHNADGTLVLDAVRSAVEDGG